MTEEIELPDLFNWVSLTQPSLPLAIASLKPEANNKVADSLNLKKHLG